MSIFGSAGRGFAGGFRGGLSDAAFNFSMGVGGGLTGTTTGRPTFAGAAGEGLVLTSQHLRESYNNRSQYQTYRNMTTSQNLIDRNEYQRQRFNNSTFNNSGSSGGPDFVSI